MGMVFVTTAAEVLDYYSEETYFKSILQERVSNTTTIVQIDTYPRIASHPPTHPVSLMAFTAWSTVDKLFSTKIPPAMNDSKNGL